MATALPSAARLAAGVFLALGFACAARAAKPAAPADAGPPGVPLADAKFEPGKETRIEDAALGGPGYYIVYVPKEYAPDRAWPAVFCYHGLNQKPTAYPFKEVLGGKGFIVIGMPYYGTGLDAFGTIAHDIENVTRLSPLLAKPLRIDPKQMLIGGFSQGGWMASEIGEATSFLWAGMAIMGAGRHGGSAKDAAGFARKPIYIGAGETDSNLDSARKAAEFYRTQGAEVTFETYAGKGHTVDTKSKVLADWLWGNGPLREMKAVLAEAQAAQAAGKPGLAYAKFTQVAAIPGGYEPCVEAGKAAQAIAQDAEGSLAVAEADAAAKRYSEAVAGLARLAALYAGSPFGDRAQKSLDALRADPKIQETLDLVRINAEAKALEEQAQVAELAKDYARAIRLYEQYVAAFPKAGRFAAVKARLDALKADKTIQSAIRAKDADRDCRNWLNMADNFLKAGLNEKAREYLKKILDQYGDTEWGAQARERMKKLK